MSRKKSNDDVAVITPRPKVKQSARWMVGVPIVGLLTIAACVAVWQKVRAHVVSGEQYQVTSEQITVTDPPAWVRADIKDDVVRDVTRTRPLTLLDSDLTVRLAAAFANHPWVSRVDRVSKRYPAGVEVSLSYRAPVAMVEVEDGTAVLPVDEHGVLLPSRGFTAEEAVRFPRIAEIRTAPAGPVGTRWGDACVLGGAQIAAAILGDWQALDLARIVPVERKPGTMGVEYTFALVTHSGSMVYWGRAPGTSSPGEVPAREKIAQLKRYAAQNGGTLDGPDGPQQIEIDGRGALLRRAKPVVAPLPKSDEE